MDKMVAEIQGPEPGFKPRTTINTEPKRILPNTFNVGIVSTKLVNAIKAMYSSVKCSIKFNDQISAAINSLSGLKQGDFNSSLSFIMFVNDIIDSI